MRTRKLIFIVIYLTSILPIFAQGQVCFAYDVAGNRVKREIVINRGSRAVQNSEDEKESFYDVMGEKIVEITHNQSGLIRVTVLNIDSDDECYIDVCSISGMQVFMEPYGGTETIIDISNQPYGVYVLRVFVNGVQTIWKITKP